MNLRVLMYHSVTVSGPPDALNIEAARLESQFAMLREGGYTTLLMSELLAMTAPGSPPLPQKPVLVTFDDGFLDNYEVAYPLAVRYGIKLNFFVVPTFISSGIYQEKLSLMKADLLKMDPRQVEFGLHSFAHGSYGDMNAERMAADIRLCKEYMAAEGIPYQPCLAYPYGAYPKDFSALKAEGIQLAFRIGNRLNPWPLANPYLIQRMDIRGDDPAWAFRAGLRMGRKWLPV